MKLTLRNLQHYKNNSINPLIKQVCNYVLHRWHDYTDKKQIFTEVINNGCRSGCVPELIYTDDCVKFYKRYHKEIVCLLKTSMQEFGIHDLKSIFRQWDEDDIFVESRRNQAILAWFGFEETLWQISNDFNLF